MNAGNIASSLFFFSKWYKTEKSHNFPETCLFSVTTVSKKRGRYVCKINICKPKAEVAFDFFLLVIDVHQSCFPIKRSRMSLFAAADASLYTKLFRINYSRNTLNKNHSNSVAGQFTNFERYHIEFSKKYFHSLIKS